MRFSQLIREFLKRTDTFCKPSTVKHYRESLLRLLDSFGDQDVRLLSPDHLQSFIEARRTQVKDISVNRDLRALKSALRYGVEIGALETLPFKVRQLRTPRKRIPRLLSREDIQELLSVAEGRVYGIILIASATGMRTDEILHLQWKDVRFEEGSLAVTSKDGWSPKSHQERSIYIPEKVLEYLKLRLQSERFREPEDWVFSNRRGDPLTVGNACAYVRQVFKEAGLYRKGEATIHLIRHSVATELLSKGVDLETVRDWLGHSSISTTALYLHVSDERRKKAARKLNLI